MLKHEQQECSHHVCPPGIAKLHIENTADKNKTFFIKIITFVFPFFVFVCYSCYRTWNIPGVIDRIYLGSILLLTWRASYLLLIKEGVFKKTIGGFFLIIPTVSLFGLHETLQHPVSLNILNFLTSFITYSYKYAGSTVEWAIPGISIIVLVLLILLKFLLKRSWALSFFCSFSLIYIFGAYHLYFTYYNLPLDHTLEDVLNQKNVTHYSCDFLPTSRNLYIDTKEEFFYAGFISTRRAERVIPPGLLKYDIIKKTISDYTIMPVRDTILYDESLPFLYVVIVEHILKVDKENLKILGYWPVRGADGIHLLDSDKLLIRIEEPLIDEPDFMILDIKSNKAIEKPLNFKFSDLEPTKVIKTIKGKSRLLARGNRKSIVIPNIKTICLISMGNGFTELHIFDYDGKIIKKITVPGFCWTLFYSGINQCLFLPSVTSDTLYKVDINTYIIDKYHLPNGIRSMTETENGVLCLSDYLRGKIYIYDTKKEKILHTFLVGRKPEGLAIGPKSGKLYVLSDFGLSIFDLPAVLQKF